MLVLATVMGCGEGDGPRSRESERRATDSRVAPASEILAALAPLQGGGLRAGELRSGRIIDVLGSGGRRLTEPRLIARIRVSTGGQRGLLGLTVDRRERTFAAYTNAARRLVVDQVAPGPARRVWDGPQSATLANGGHLEVSADGRELLVGIGDLQRRATNPDPQGAAGTLLALDPDGPPSQKPRTLSRGWNNPFAFTTLPGGGVLVADNAPGVRPERLARADAGGGPPRAVTTLRGRRAASGLAALSDDEVALCGVVSGRLERFRADARERWRSAGDLGACRYGVAVLEDGRVAVSDDEGIRIVTP